MIPSKQLADLAKAEGFFVLPLAPERFSIPTAEAVDQRARVLCGADGRSWYTGDRLRESYRRAAREQLEAEAKAAEAGAL